MTEEFYTLGDRERSLGLHPSPLCNRATDTNIPASQMGFFKFLCVPFYATVADLLDPKMTPWLRLKENYRAWKAVRYIVLFSQQKTVRSLSSFVRKI